MPFGGAEEYSGLLEEHESALSVERRLVAPAIGGGGKGQV